MAFGAIPVHSLLLCFFLILCSAFRLANGNASYMNSDIGYVGKDNEQLNLITGVTQVSVSATMSEFISVIDEPATQFYLKLSSGSWHYVTVEDAENELEFSFYDLTNGVCESDEPKIEKAANLGYYYAFSGQYGNPDVHDPSDIPEPIVFNQLQGFLVSYYMVMKTFDLTAIEYNRDVREECVLRISQSEMISSDPEGMPLVFNYTVNLDLSLLDVDEDNMKDLPQQTQDIINRFGPGMFSMDQLFMDLNTAELIQGLPTIPGLDPLSETALLLTQFLKIYMENMDPDGNGVLFGYTVTAHEDPKYEPSIIPTDLNFYINPYLDGDLNPTTNYDLYTLNYWMSSDGNTLPYPSRLRWNWIDESEKDRFDGVMTVRRALLAERLADKLNSEMSRNLCYNVLAELIECEKDSGGWWAKFRSGVENCVPEVPYTVVKIADESKNGLSLTFEHHDDDTWTCDKFSPDFYAHQFISIDTHSNVYFKGGAIYIESETDVYFKLSCEANSEGTHGHFAHYKTEAYYDLAVDDEAGKITTTLRNNEVITEDLSDEVEIDEGHCTIESVTDSVNSIVDNISRLQGFMDSYARSINEVLNGQLDFVFPGGNTFRFKDVIFSDNGDMMSHIEYIGYSEE